MSNCEQKIVNNLIEKRMKWNFQLLTLSLGVGSDKSNYEFQTNFVITII